MNVGSTTVNPLVTYDGGGPSPSAARLQEAGNNDPQLREAFDSFVGETFYGQMLSAMRKSLGKPAYFHGGRAEEMFRGQLDQILAQEMTKSNAGDLAGSMFEQFRLSQLSRS